MHNNHWLADWYLREHQSAPEVRASFTKMTKRVLITGGTGSIGQRVIKSLLRQGYGVVSVSRKENAEENKPNLMNVQCDFRDSAKLAPLISEVDCVCHLGAYIPAHFNDPEEAKACFEINSLATLELARHSLAARKRFIFTSSGSLYGAQDHASVETDIVFPATHAPYYLGSKLMAEVYIEHLRASHGLESLIFRVGSAYGPGCRKSVVARFIERVVNHQPMILNQGGRGSADFVYVDDLAELMLKAIEGDSFGIFNAGSGRSHTILELSKLIREAFPEFAPKIEVMSDDDSIPAMFPALSATKCSSAFAHQPTPLHLGIALLKEHIQSSPSSLW
jgi:UDP-glucose 4-epimerase